MRYLCHLVIGLLLLMPVRVGLAQSLEIIDLRHRPAEEVLPLVRPFLAPGGTLTGQRGQLFIRTTPANLSEIKALLATLDRSPRQLQITVLQGEAADLADDESRLNASIGLSGRGRLAVGEGTGSDTAELRVRRSRSRTRGDEIQRVRVLEGRAATIYLGQSIPVGSRSSTIIPGGVQNTDSIEYRQVERGFSVLPRISGERVMLEIGAQRDQLSRSGGGRIEVQGISTTVSGTLGEWIELGGVVNAGIQRQSGVIHRSTEHLEDKRRILVKVEQLP